MTPPYNIRSSYQRIAGPANLSRVRGAFFLARPIRSIERHFTRPLIIRSGAGLEISHSQADEHSEE